MQEAARSIGPRLRQGTELPNQAQSLRRQVRDVDLVRLIFAINDRRTIHGGRIPSLTKVEVEEQIARTFIGDSDVAMATGVGERGVGVGNQGSGKRHGRETIEYGCFHVV